MYGVAAIYRIKLRRVATTPVLVLELFMGNTSFTVGSYVEEINPDAFKLVVSYDFKV